MLAKTLKKIKINGVELGGPITLKVDKAFGVYGVGHFDLRRNFGLYALVGFSWMSAYVSTSDNTEVDVSEDSDFSFGGGLEYAFTTNTSVKVEYMSYLRDRNGGLNTFSIGLHRKF